MYPNLLSIGFGRILLSRFKYRDRAAIVGDILDSVCGDPRGKTKTSIMRRANLNHDQINRYLELLLLRGLIKVGDPLRSQELARYRVTEKGLELIRILQMSHHTLR